jgi:hypothetical protein
MKFASGIIQSHFRCWREFPTVPGEPEWNPTLGLRMAEFEQRRQMSTRVGSLANDGPRQDGEDGVNGNNSSHRRRGTHGLSPRDADPGTPPSRADSGADLSQRRTPQSTLQIPKRTYTSPREVTTIPTRMNDMDSPVRTAGVPTIVTDAIETPI